MQDYYRQALDFYERLTNDPSGSPRLRALAFRRLGFTRMVSQRENRLALARAAADFHRSIALYERLIAAEPGDAELRDGLADAHYNLGMLLVPLEGIDASEPSFRTAIALAEQQAVNAMDRAALEGAARRRLAFAARLEQFHKPAEAMRERRAVLDLFERLTDGVSPGDLSAGWSANVYRALAQAMAEHGWKPEQEQALRRGLTFLPDDVGLLNGLAHLLAFRDDADDRILTEAVALARKALDVVPARSDSWMVIARAHFRARKYQEAAEAVEKSMRLAPENGQTSGRLLMAMISDARGRLDDARAWYIRALDRQVQDPDKDPDVPAYSKEAREMLQPVP